MEDLNQNDVKHYPRIINIELGIINTGYTSDLNDVDLYENGNESGIQRNGGVGKSDLSSRPNGTPNPAADDFTGEQKSTWSNQFEFLLSCIAMSVGLGNVWRFPFTAYENGGGAFLLPYCIALIVVGRPMYYLEMCLGQFSSKGPVKVWDIVPLFKGVGYSSMIAVLCTVSFYCSIMALTLYYTILSFFNPLPWSEAACSYYNDTTPNFEVCDAHDQFNTSLSELYYSKSVFPQLKNIDDGIGKPHGILVACLFATWIFIGICLIKGIRSAGKVSYFTGLFPYVVLIGFLIKGLTLPGSWNGIYYFLVPQWDKILSPKVWFAAVSQCFFSLTVGFGTITFLSSHNKFRHNIYRDAIVISVTDTLTSILAGCTIFAILGYLAEVEGVDISKVTKGGPGLAFIAFPEALAKLTWFPQGFAVSFFLMLFTLGAGSAVALTGQMITTIQEDLPSIKGWIITLVMCLIGFLSGIVYVTPGGPFILTLVNHNGADFIIYITAILEIIAIAWIYGVKKFCKDIKFMLGRDTSLYWRFCWTYIMPIFLCSLLVYYFSQYERLTFDGVSFPTSAVVCGWILSGISLSCLPLCAIAAVRNAPGDTWMEKLKASVKPKSSWGPSNPAERELWLKMKQKDEDDDGAKYQVDRRMSTASTVAPTSEP